ncbi:MAG: Protein GrpE [Holosporales bacterium]
MNETKHDDVTIENTETESNTEKSLPEEQPDLQEQLNAMKDQWLRAVAEIENTRRRAQREKEDALKFAATHFAKDMIAITDYLEQALTTMQDQALENESFKAFFQGVDMTAKELHNVFARHGIKKIDPDNKKFDPNLHQAMMEIPTDEHAPGQIVQILQHGYTLHDRLLRPSMVGVAKAKS